MNRRHGKGVAASVLGAASMVALASASPAREIRLPLSVETPLIRDALVKELFNDPKQRAVFWGTPGECSFFFLEDPQVDGEVDRLKVTAHGEARAGADFGDSCLSPLAWTGILEVFEKPRLDGWTLRFDVVDSNIYDEHHEKPMLLGPLWDRIKESVQPRFASVTVDLQGPFRDLRDFLPTVVSPDHAEQAKAALDSMRPVAVHALPRGIVVEAAFEVADAAPAPQPTEAPLSQSEIETFTARANQWDSFVTFVIETLGAKTLSAPARRALLATLLDARQNVVEALSSPQHHGDPVRQLFLGSWDRLRPVAGEIARELPGAEAAGVLTFVAAGDALQALDQAGPSLGVEVSADGLRRMARMIAPQATVDPLEYREDVDPAMRQFLGFGSPLAEQPIPPEAAPPAEAPAAAPSPLAPPASEPIPAATAAPPAPPAPTASPGASATTLPEPAPQPEPKTPAAPAASPVAAPTLPPPPTITGWNLFRWLLPGEALAAPAAKHGGDRSSDWKGWVAEQEANLDAYLKRVSVLLSGVSSRAVQKDKRLAAHGDLLRKLVAATAWQESCWRQFVVKGGKVTYMRSSQASVGMMQVNERVWRGFYEVDKLRWKVSYNADAGTEVLIHYLDLARDAVGDDGGKTTPAAADLARAVYAGYNGGPGQLERYLDTKKRGKALTRVIDKLFGTKFAAAGDGMEKQVAACLGGAPSSPG